MLVGQRAYLFFVDLRRVHVVHHVARSKSPPHGLLESLVQDDVQLVDGGTTQIGVELVSIEALYVSRIQGLQLLLVQRWDQMLAAQVFVALVRALPNRATDAVFEPALYKRAYRQSAGVGSNALLGLCQGLCELL
jgi:hypothetical protein